MSVTPLKLLVIGFTASITIHEPLPAEGAHPVLPPHSQSHQIARAAEVQKLHKDPRFQIAARRAEFLQLQFSEAEARRSLNTPVTREGVR